jgi:hypothetical protein
MKSIRTLFNEHEGKLIHKWDHYFDIYDRYLSNYRGQQINILEIGISHGGSMQLWKKYFGDKAHIFAVDVNPECKKLQEENTTIFIGSQSDPVFLADIIKKMPLLDVVIDDGGHTMIQQKTSFEYLYPRVKDNGIYIVEDTHTSYWHQYHGGYKKRSSFIEYSKNLIDALYDGHIENEPRLKPNNITKNINSITFFDSVVVFEKKLREKPFHLQKGTETITSYNDKSLKKENIFRKLFGAKNKNDSFWRNFKGKV